MKIAKKNTNMMFSKNDISRLLFALSWLLGTTVVIISIVSDPKVTPLGLVIPVVSDSTYNFLIFFISTFTVNYLGRKATDAWHNKSIVGLTTGGNVAMNNMPTNPNPYGNSMYGNSMMPGMSMMSPGMPSYNNSYNTMNPMSMNPMSAQVPPSTTLPNGNKANLQQSMPVIINVNESKNQIIQNEPNLATPPVGLSNIQNLHNS